MRALLERLQEHLPEPTQRAFRGALIIAVVAVALAVVMAWRATPRASERVGSGEFGDSSGFDTSQAIGAASSSSNVFFDERSDGEIIFNSSEALASEVLYVHVTGQVQNPGVVELPPGSRVVAALEAAGGLREGAKPGGVNLARVLVDGEQIYFGTNPPKRLNAVGTPRAQPPAPASIAPKSSLINLNSATTTDLELLPGVGPTLAKRILEFRDKHGGFRVVEDLLEVKGIGAKTLKEISPHVTV